MVLGIVFRWWECGHVTVPVVSDLVYSWPPDPNGLPQWAAFRANDDFGVPEGAD